MTYSAEEQKYTLHLLPREGGNSQEGRIEMWLKRGWAVSVILPDDLDRPEEHTEEEFEALMLWLFQAAREIVFGVTAEGKYFLVPIGWVVNPDTALQELRPLFRFVTAYENQVKSWLFRTMLIDLPIIAENQEAGMKLSEIYKDLQLNGFSINQEDGNPLQVAVDLGPYEEVAKGAHSVRAVVQPFEIIEVLEQLNAERLSTSRAKTLILRVDAAISELSLLLERSERNEHDLQRCLTANAILFGTRCRRVIPKHSLGSEYEIDYVLELTDGGMDVMEIEASTHSLYTKKGNPTAILTHAEQQVYDWLFWLEENSAYARTKLPNLHRPRGIVVIGRRSSLSTKDAERLNWRNRSLDNRIKIFTFDDLLDNAIALRDLLLEEK